MRHFQSEFDVLLRTSVVPDVEWSDWHSQSVDFIAESSLDEVDAIYMEGGWESARLPLNIALGYVLRGGQLIVSDVRRVLTPDELTDLRSAAPLFGCGLDGSDPFSIAYLYDPARDDQGSTIFQVAGMRVSGWPSSALLGLDALVVGEPLLLVGAPPAATGCRRTEVLRMDSFEEHLPFPSWATVIQRGLGHAAVIAAVISDDRRIEANPDNARWLSALLIAMCDRTAESQVWFKGASGSPWRRVRMSGRHCSLKSRPHSSERQATGRIKRPG
jgi:hypothetical protein